MYDEVDRCSRRKSSLARGWDDSRKRRQWPVLMSSEVVEMSFVRPGRKILRGVSCTDSTLCPFVDLVLFDCTVSSIAYMATRSGDVCTENSPDLYAAEPS